MKKGNRFIVFIAIISSCLYFISCNELSEDKTEFSMGFYDPKVNLDTIYLDCMGSKEHGVYNGFFKCVCGDSIFLEGYYKGGVYDSVQTFHHKNDGLKKYYYYENKELIYEKEYKGEEISSCTLKPEIGYDGQKFVFDMRHTNLDSFQYHVQISINSPENVVSNFFASELRFKRKYSFTVDDSLVLFNISEINTQTAETICDGLIRKPIIDKD